jgi:hypothetical protein
MTRGIMTFLPGKIAQGMKLLDEMLTLANKKYGPIPNVKKYTPWYGGDNAMHTIVLEMEWNSLIQMAEFYEKANTDPEMMGTMSQWETIMESDREELYTVME